jgi:hypothetical protein
MLHLQCARFSGNPRNLENAALPVEVGCRKGECCVGILSH